MPAEVTFHWHGTSVVTHFEIRFSYGRHFTGILMWYDGDAQAIK
jgi:hypothetical protein